MLKILVLNWRDPLHPEAGGAEVHLDKVLSYLATKYKVVLVSTRVTSKDEMFTHNGYEVIREGHPLLFNFTFYFQWKNKYSKQGFDIVIDDISKIGLQTPLYIKDIPIVSIFHHVHGHTLFQLIPFPMSLYVYIMERVALKSYVNTVMVVVSESSKKELLKIAPFKNLTVLHNGIGDEYLKIKRISKTPFQICVLSRLTKAKRVDVSLKVFKLLLNQIPESRLFIAGKGSEEEKLKKLSKDLNINHAVKFLGFITEEEKLTLLEQSEALLFTSEKEGWGITALESSASSTPVFGFDVPGIRDAVQENINGRLVSFNDVDKLAIKLEEYLNSNNKNELQSRANCYAKNFSWDRIVKEFEIIMLTTKNH